MRALTAPASLADIERALSYIPADDRELWYRLGAAIKLEFGDAGLEFGMSGQVVRRSITKEPQRRCGGHSSTTTLIKPQSARLSILRSNMDGVMVIRHQDQSGQKLTTSHHPHRKSAILGIPLIPATHTT